MIERLARCRGAARTYGSGHQATVALQPCDCEVDAGDRIALAGPSGSGKSTLLHLLAGLDGPSMGTVDWPAIGGLGDLRPGPVAVVFQGPSLMAPLTVEDNVALTLILAGSDDSAARREAREALKLVGLSGLGDKLPEEISGGQAQRVAVARALAGRPSLILADEPTGQLDRQSGTLVVDVLLEAAAQGEAGLVVATHDPEVAGRLAAQWTMSGGRLDVDALEPA